MPRADLSGLWPSIDLDARTVRVTRQLYYDRAGYSFGPPASRAGVRVVDFPELIVPDLRAHLDWLPVSAGSSSPARPAHHWRTPTSAAVLAPRPDCCRPGGLYLHDLRHTGNQLTANAGANPKELMARMGHDSERAALI